MTGRLLASLASGLPWTVALAALAFVAGAVPGLGLCALRLSRRPPLRILSGAIILAIRSVPSLIWLLLALVGTGAAGLPLGPFAASLLGLGLVAAADLAEIYRRALSSVPAGQWDAAATLDLPPRSRFRDAIAPQLLPAVLAPAAALAARLLRESAVAALIGAGGLAAEADRAARAGADPLATYAAAAALYLALSLAVVGVASLTARRLRAGTAW